MKRHAMRRLAGVALACALLGSWGIANAGVARAEDQSNALPAGGKWHYCHGTMDHVSAVNLRVHCMDGNPMDLSFISWPKLASFSDGHTVQSSKLIPGTPVTIVFTVSLGFRHAYQITVREPGQTTTFKT